MSLRCIGPAWVAALVILSAAGCKESESGPAAPAKTSTPVAQTVARVHWLGMKQLAAGTNAGPFMEIWNLPASEKLAAQTLDKLSLAPWRLLKGDAATNGAPIARLRPLLDDLVQEESYLEIRSATNLPGELVFAIRLSPERSGLWETNLAAVLASLTGIQPVPATGGHPGWSMIKHDQPKRIEFTRAGDWTLLGLSPEKNALLDDFIARITRDHAPFTAPATNFWLGADFDLRRVGSALGLGWNLPEELPQISLTVTRDRSGIITSGNLQFAKMPSFDLGPWNVPTNLISDPLVSFTAIRGLQPWLAPLKIWKDLPLGAPPNQLYVWALGGIPAQTYFAAPLPDASNDVRAITKRLIQKVNPWMTTNATGYFTSPTNFNGVAWAGEPFLGPFLRSLDSPGGSFAFGGLFPNPRTNRPPPPELLPQFIGQTNMAYYDWELTGPRIKSWIYITQTLRLLFNKPQLPVKSAGMKWLQAIEPKLGNCATSMTQTGANQLSFHRSSQIGFTAIELSLLADWLESPQFPRGFHTLLAPLPQLVPARPPQPVPAPPK